MEIFIGERISTDNSTKRSIENIVSNTLYKGQFEINRKGNNILVNITNSHYLATETQKDLIYQIRTTLQDIDCKYILYTNGKHTMDIN